MKAITRAATTTILGVLMLAMISTTRARARAPQDDAPPPTPESGSIQMQVYTDEPGPTATPTLPGAPTAMAGPVTAPFPGYPSLTVSAPTHCRTGSGISYALVYTLLPGTIAAIVEADPTRNYYLITVPGSPGTTCWLWGYYAQLTGESGSVPLAPSPAPASLSYSLSEPKHVSATCSSEPYADDGDDEVNDLDDASTWTVTVSWMNTEPNQTAVRVYRYNRRIATLGPGARSYTDTFVHYDYYHGAQYGVQAVGYNTVSSIVWTYMNSCR